MSFSLENPEATILVAVDEEAFRKLLKTNLERSGGYSLLLAEDGQDALHMAHDHKGKIDLLISDLQMAGMTGVDLAKQLHRSRPEMRIMLTSAYPQGLLILHTGWTFLQKPYLPSTILDSVRDVLNAQAPQKAAAVKRPALVPVGGS